MSAKRLEELLEVLLPADWAVLGLAVRLRIISGDQAVRVVWPKASAAEGRAARRTLIRLVEWKLLVRLERRVGGLGAGSSSWSMSPTVACYRLLGMAGQARRPHLPRPAMWRHALGVSEVYCQLREATNGSERSLVTWEGEPECWRRYTSPEGDRIVVKPDAYFVVKGTGFADHQFLELDSGSQSRAVIRAKLLAYRHLAAAGEVTASLRGVFPVVVFATTTELRLRVLQRLITELPERGRPMFAAVLIKDAGAFVVGPSS